MPGPEETSAPLVPARLTCRYSNGIVMNFVGRVVMLEGRTLRVLVSEKFDTGILITATASVLTGPTVCRVAAVESSADHPGMYVTDLRSVKAPPPAPKPKPPPAAPVPDHLREAAAELARHLERGAPSMTMEAAITAMPAKQAGAGLMALSAAVLVLLEKKKLLDAMAIAHTAATTR